MNCLLGPLAEYASAEPRGRHTHCSAGGTRNIQGGTAGAIPGGLEVTQAPWVSSWGTSTPSRGAVIPQRPPRAEGGKGTNSHGKALSGRPPFLQKRHASERKER